MSESRMDGTPNDAAPASNPAGGKGQADADWSVARILTWTTQYLKQHGSDTPRLDAEILLAHVRQCPRIQLYVQYGELLSLPQRERMRELVRRRAQAEPVAYLVGHREFFSLDFEVTADVLIPRPETETLVLELLTALRDRSAPRLLDVGTGSGCIAVTAARQLKAAHVTAVDISEAAAGVARRNAARHGVGDRVEVIVGDLWSQPAIERRYDAIVSNPPYVAEGEIDALPETVRRHEPRLALAAGADGLDVVRRIVTEGPRWLTPGGWLLLEISPEQAGRVEQLFRETGFVDVRTVRDDGGLQRVVLGRQPAAADDRR